MLSRVRSMKRPWLYEGITTETLGQFMSFSRVCAWGDVLFLSRCNVPPSNPPTTNARPASHAVGELVDVAAGGLIPNEAVELLRRVVERAGERQVRVVVRRAAELQFRQPFRKVLHQPDAAHLVRGV